MYATMDPTCDGYPPLLDHFKSCTPTHSEVVLFADRVDSTKKLSDCFCVILRLAHRLVPPFASHDICTFQCF